MRYTVVYAYYERDATYRDNLYHFLKHGCVPGVRCIVVVNGNPWFGRAPPGPNDAPTAASIGTAFRPA